MCVCVLARTTGQNSVAAKNLGIADIASAESHGDMESAIVATQC